MMIAMTSSSHMMAPRLKTKPRSHSTTSIAATTKSKSSNPIFKSLIYPNLERFILRCVTVNKQLQLQLHHPFYLVFLAYVCVFELFLGSIYFKTSA
jgi:hypothetical protein